jgi:hypothetical protein
MDSAKYIGLDVRKESISIAVLNAADKLCWAFRNAPLPTVSWASAKSSR